MFRSFLLALLSLAPLLADPVSLEEKGGLAILSNGIITATVEKDSASLNSLRFRDTEFVRQERGGAYFSMDGGKNFRVHHRTPDLIDIAITQSWKSQVQAV